MNSILPAKLCRSASPLISCHFMFGGFLFAGAWSSGIAPSSEEVGVEDLECWV